MCDTSTNSINHVETIKRQGDKDTSIIRSADDEVTTLPTLEEGTYKEAAAHSREFYFHWLYIHTHIVKGGPETTTHRYHIHRKAFDEETNSLSLHLSHFQAS